ncbi:MAG TPA: 2-dehydropantoate 2-reductase [Anaerolineales bacterium]|jgi:2-dehydropantoate 2-reductase
MQDPDSGLLIVGSGAMASLFAARLAPVTEVTMLAGWPQALAAIGAEGLRLGNGQSERQIPMKIVDSTASLANVKRALVLVKAWQTERVAAQLAACLAPDGLALTLQNGLGNLQTLAQTLGEDRVALGVTTYGATLLGPGHVLPAGEGRIDLGAHQRIESFWLDLRSAGFDVRIVENVTSLAWGKLTINAGINPLTALLRVPNGHLADQPDARSVLRDVVREVDEVAAGHGIALPFDDPFESVLEVAKRTAANLSSMLQDLARGAPTEIDAISGQVVTWGQAAGVPTPVNEALWRLVRAAAAGGPHEGR